MAFALADFVVFNWSPGAAGANGMALASYTTDDDAATVAGDDYFNSVAHLLPAGSQIFVAADMDGTPEPVHYVVASNDGTTVAVTATTDLIE